MLEHINSWSQRAKCREIPFADMIFFPPTGKGHAGNLVSEGKKFCTGCPVISQCKIYAIAHDMYGIWGGTTRSERNKLSMLTRNAIKAMYLEARQLEPTRYHNSQSTPKRVQKLLLEYEDPIAVLVIDVDPTLSQSSPTARPYT